MFQQLWSKNVGKTLALTLGSIGGLVLVVPVVMAANNECPSMQDVIHQLIDEEGCFEHNGTRICNADAGRAVEGFKNSWGTVGVLGGDIVETGATSCTYIPTYDNTPAPPHEPPCLPNGCKTLPPVANEPEKNADLVIWISNDNEASCRCGYGWRENMVFQPMPEFQTNINKAASQD